MGLTLQFVGTVQMASERHPLPRPTPTPGSRFLKTFSLEPPACSTLCSGFWEVLLLSIYFLQISSFCLSPDTSVSPLSRPPRCQELLRSPRLP